MDTHLLRAHQVAPAKRLRAILENSQTALDGSDTGTGKTFVAAYVAASLGLPTLAVVPKISVSNWLRTAKHFDDEISALSYESLRTGNTPFGWWENPPPKVRAVRHRCVNCQCWIDEDSPPCYCRPDGIHGVETSKVPHNYGKFFFHANVRFLILDEVHRCSAPDSLNSELLIAARRQGIKTLMLSATPACSPGSFRALGYALDLFRLPEYYAWASRHGWRRLPGVPGLRWTVGEARQNAVMRSIRETIFPARGVRLTREEIPGFPECDISAELYDLDQPELIDKLYAEMAAPLDALKQHALDDKSSEHPLTKRLRSHQKIELLKVPVAAELANDYLAKGFSVGFFINFEQTLEELRLRFPDAAIISGSHAAARQKHLARFQKNKTRTIIVNNKAGGESCDMQDLDGNFPRAGLVFPCDSATMTRQLLGRFPRDGAKSRSLYRFIFAANSVETKIHRALKTKLNNLDSLTDADLDPNNLSINEL